MVEQAPRSAPQRLRRRLIRLAIGLVFLTALATGYFPQEPLRRIAERQLQRHFGSSARIGRLRFIPALLAVHVTDVRVETADLSVVLPAARLDLSAISLLGRRIAVDAIEIHAPRVSVRTRATQDANPFTFTKTIEVRRVLVADAEILLTDGDKTLAKISGVGARGAVGRGTLEIEAREAVVMGQPLLGAHGLLRLSPALDLTLDSLEIRAQRSHLAIRGQVTHLLAQPRADLRVTAEIDLADIAATRGAPLAGKARIEGTFTGSHASGVHAEATISAKDLSAYTLDLSGTALHLQHSPEMGTNVQGSVDLMGGRATIEARLHESRLDTQISLDRLALDSLPQEIAAAYGPHRGRISGHLRTHGSLSQSQVAGRLDVEAAWAALPDTRMGLDVMGTVDAEQRLVDLGWTIDATAQSAAQQSLGLRTGRLRARGRSIGPWPPRTEIDLTGRAQIATPVGQATTTLSGQARIDGHDIAFHLTAEIGAGRATLDARMTGDQVRQLEVVAQDIALRTWAPDMAGRLNLHFSAAGTLARMTHSGQIEARALAWRGVPFGDVTLNERGAGRHAILTLKAPAIGLAAESRLDAHTPNMAAVEATLDQTPLAPFAPLAGRPLTGQLSGRIEARVPLDQPQRAVGLLRLSHAHVESDSFTASLALPLVARIQDQRLFVDTLSLTAPGLQIAARGDCGMTRDSRINSHIRFTTDLKQSPQPQDWTLAGLIDGEVDLSGTLSRPQARGELRIAQAALTAAPWPAVHIPRGTIELAGDRAIIRTITAEIGQGRIDAEGVVPFTALPISKASVDNDIASTITVRWQNLAVEPWLAAAMPAAHRDPVIGDLSGQAQISGRVLALEEVQVALALGPTHLASGGMSIDIEPIELSLAAGRLATKGIRLRSKEGTVELGGALDLKRQTLALAGQGVADLQTFSPFLKTVGLTGIAEGRLDATGTLAAPVVSGGLTLKRVSVRSRDFAQPLTDIEARIVFDHSALRIVNASARLGGGMLKSLGTARLSGKGIADLDLVLTGRDIALRYPAGLWSRLNADLTLTGQPSALLLGGAIHAVSGIYTEDLATEKTLFAPVPVVETAPLLRSVRLNLELLTDNPIRVRNDVARLNATGRLVIQGDMEVPQVFGHLDVLAPGGQAFLQGREFSIDSGRLSYEGSWVPVLSLTGTTSFKYPQSEAGDQAFADKTASTLVTAQATAVAHGTSLEIMNAWAARMAGNTDPSLDETLTLTSDSSLSQAKLASFLATGRSQESLRGQEVRSLGEQAATLVATRLAAGASKGLTGLGLDEVRVQPELLGREGEPGARFTFGKRLTPYARLIYSRGLGNIEESFFNLEVEPGWKMLLALKRQDDGTFVYGAGQRISFGGQRTSKSAPSSQERVRITDVRFEGAPDLLRASLMGQVRVRPGQSVAPWDLQEDAERLAHLLNQDRYLTADVGAGLVEGRAIFTINAGPRYVFEVLGMEKPPNLARALTRLLYEDEARERGGRDLLRVLRQRGYLSAAIDFEVAPVPVSTGAAPNERILTFRVRPGPKYAAWRLKFPGARSLSSRQLIAASGGAGELLVSQDEAVARLTALYRARNFLQARVGPARTTILGHHIDIEVPVEEGPPARITDVRFEGASLSGEALLAATGLALDEPYLDARLLDALTRLRDHYYKLGNSNVRVAARLEPRAADLDVIVRVEEGECLTIAGTEVRGASGALARRVLSDLSLKPGAPLDPRVLAKAERRLLDLPGIASARITPSSANPAMVIVDIDRAPWARASYDLHYDAANKLGGLVDAELGEIGRLGTVGGRYRVGSDVRELRGSLHSTLLGGKGLTGSVFRLTEDLSPSPALTQNVQTGVEIQHAFRLPDRWSLLAGYRFKRVTVTSFTPVDLGALEMSLMRESRDNPLDATRGRFLSLNMELSHPRLASTASFFKGFGQAFFARSLHPRLVWAQGFRLGLAHVFPGGPLLSFERFRAGGPNSVRGFATDAIGPRGYFDNPIGGQAVFVVNQELRYRHRTGLGVAGFYDLGNIFTTVRDIRLSARHSLGAGLRFSSPIGLVRFDLAWPLAPQLGESRSRRMFSIGQAF